MTRTIRSGLALAVFTAAAAVGTDEIARTQRDAANRCGHTVLVLGECFERLAVARPLAQLGQPLAQDAFGHELRQRI